MFLRSLATLVAVAIVTPAWADDVFKLTAQNTKVTFVGTKANGKHDGGFKTVKGTVTVKESDLAKALFTVDIDINSMYTDAARLTNHLKSADFFDAKKYPTAKFISTEVVKKDEGYEVTGKLTMHGVTKEVKFPAKLEVNGSELNLESDFEINRQDWKISFGPGQVNDVVKIAIKVKAKKS